MLFAFTPNDYIEHLPEWTPVLKISLDPIPERALYIVFKRICELYVNAYDIKMDPKIADAIFQKVLSTSGHTRLFVKGSIEILDLFRYNSKNLVTEVLS